MKHAIRFPFYFCSVLFVSLPLLATGVVLPTDADATTVDSGVSVAEEGVDEDVVDPANALRQSARSSGAAQAMVNASDLQELRDRANANVSQSLSNTSLADLESDNLTQLLQLRYRERKRQERLLVIQTQILQRLRMSRQPNISASVFSQEEQRRINAMVERMHQFNNNGNNNNAHNSSPKLEPRVPFETHHLNSDDSATSGGTRLYRLHTTMQRLQSFYPSCSLPNNTDKNTWELPGTLRVYYELPFSRYTLGPEVTILLAKLRLFKVSPTSYQRWEPNLHSLSRYNLLDALIQNSPTSVINVSVYQYVKPLRPNRKERKRLVDSRTLALEHEGWVEFNVVSSLNHWLHHYNRNFGFDVEVEDAFGNNLNPNRFFRNMNCSVNEENPQDSPFPNIMELHPEMMGENESSLFDNETYPTLDLQTADVTTLDAAAFHLFQPSPFSNGGEAASRRVMRKRHLHHSNHHHHHHSRAREVGICREETSRASFADLGLEDVIISPSELVWTFCSGHCAEDSPEEVSRNTLLERVQKERSALSRLSRILESLLKASTKKVGECRVSSRTSLRITYYNDEGEMDEAVLDNFVPSQCSCSSS